MLPDEGVARYYQRFFSGKQRRKRCSHFARPRYHEYGPGWSPPRSPKPYHPQPANFPFFTTSSTFNPPHHGPHISHPVALYTSSSRLESRLLDDFSGPVCRRALVVVARCSTLFPLHVPNSWSFPPSALSVHHTPRQIDQSIDSRQLCFVDITKESYRSRLPILSTSVFLFTSTRRTRLAKSVNAWHLAFEF
jgi:hypothetical protein